MAAGKLRELLAFEQLGRSDDGYGNLEADGWEEVFRAAADVLPLRGGETVIAARLQGTQPVLITVRSCASTRAVTPDWRARDVRTGLVYNIRTNPQSVRKDYQEMIAEAGVPT